MDQTFVIAVIGPGAMAEAIIAGLLRNNIVTADRIVISGPELDHNEELEVRYGIKTLWDNELAVREADAVILSVKPQILPRVMEGLRNRIPAKAVVLSIVAGASIEMIREGLNHDCIVRSMPNTPAQIGEGITVWTNSPAVSENQMGIAREVLSALGAEVYVEEENYLDMATALSGTGPAYTFLFMEAMIDAGVHLGFPRRIAEQLVVQTLRGSVDYFVTKKAHPASLRNEVTSPGGTSAAALYYLEKAGFRTAISRAVWAAYERSQELGKGKEAHPPEGRSPENDSSHQPL
ncbi:MAG: pyrroline-5-carboxylate reductase [Anaerolineaceae bacterium]|nr:pyrroline-5-carboxylate reductase [Anaerolineaceae bacterium]